MEFGYIPGRMGRGGQEERVRKRDPFGRLSDPSTTRLEASGLGSLFTLGNPVGRRGGNNRRDVARVETLLGGTGHLDLNQTEGPTGYFGDRLDQVICGFQKDNSLRVDGVLNPGGETINALGKLFASASGKAFGKAPDLLDATSKGPGDLTRWGGTNGGPFVPDPERHGTKTMEMRRDWVFKNGRWRLPKPPQPHLLAAEAEAEAKPKGQGSKGGDAPAPPPQPQRPGAGSGRPGGKQEPGKPATKLPTSWMRVRLPGSGKPVLIDQKPPKEKPDGPIAWFNPDTGYPTVYDPKTGKPVNAPDGKPYDLSPNRTKELLEQMNQWAGKDPGKLSPLERQELHGFVENTGVLWGIGKGGGSDGREKGNKPVPQIDKFVGSPDPGESRSNKDDKSGIIDVPGDTPPDDPPRPPGPPPVFPAPTPPRRDPKLARKVLLWLLSRGKLK